MELVKRDDFATRITEDYVCIAETDHLLLKAPPNLVRVRVRRPTTYGSRRLLTIACGCITAWITYGCSLDYLRLQAPPNRATPQLNVAFFFPYMSPVPSQQAQCPSSIP
mgnify:FL=1|tara:strand:- start:640 stop:966 length:327 start_codon:yes stop_codon:yes gene_type:complete